jgi:hypothetical protein
VNLMEATVSALLFCGSAVSSLQIWSLALVSTEAAERRQLAFDRLDAALVASEARLRGLSRQGTGAFSCGSAAGELHRWLQQEQPGPGLRRELTLQPSGEAVLLQLAADGVETPRRRLYRPEVLGLCPDLSGSPSEAEDAPR